MWAQGATDVLAGGAGWAGAGLLGLVLSWLLLKHLPDKDKMVRELVKECHEDLVTVAAKYDVSLRELRADYMASLKDSRGDFKEALEVINERQDRRINDILLAIHREIESFHAVQRTN